MNIYFDTKGQIFDNVEQLLNFGYYNGFFPVTYKDPEFTEVEFRSARRSLSDLILIAKTYFPETTPEQVAYILYYKIEGLRCFFCPTAGKVVFVKGYITKYKSSGHATYERAVGGPSDRVGSDGYSYDIIKQMAIKYKKENEHIPEN